MTITLKALGALLTYPGAELRAAFPEIATALAADGLLTRRHRASLGLLVNELQALDPLDAEERYVLVFDRGRRTSLHLFEHVHGESRDRGQAMVDLRATYERAGFHLSAHELPDYLPALLEFLAFRPLAEARDMLADCANILRTVGEALVERENRYAAVFDALLYLAREPRLGNVRTAPAVAEKPMDEEWAEEPVIFGPPGAPGGCGAGAAAEFAAGRR